MTPANVSGITQAFPLRSAEIPSSPPQGEKSVSSPNAGTGLPKDAKNILADTVSIAQQSLQTLADVKKENTKIEGTNGESKSKGTDTGTAKVQFLYDLKGDLISRYLDSANRLVYQVPSELKLREAETAPKSELSVDTNA